MIDGICLCNAIISGANNLSRHKMFVNDLNIFPVPDGDTGTNMSMTVNSAVKEIENISKEHVGDVAKLIASSMLRGARGNSGVILSLLFKGFASGLANLNTADGASVVMALGLGVDAAYKAVMKPTEGTMLTVARVAYEKGREAALFDNDIIAIWEAICDGANEALKQTPDLLPVLKKAGVVDAGGKGLCLIFEGMLSVLKDGVILKFDDNSEISEKNFDVSDFANTVAQFDGDINFTYCTELIISRNDKSKDPQNLRSALEKIGDCVVVVDDDEIIKVHVHTEDPGLVLQEGILYGEFINVKVENMREQHRLAQKKAVQQAKKKLEPCEPVDEVGFVSVATGDGVKKVFEDLGCLHVVTGGQTMNPSTEDILEAVLATPGKTVYILPNNKNIILAAEQTIPLVKDRRVIIIPTKTIPQGISAMIAYDPDSSISENTVFMTKSAGSVSTGQITFASRDAEFGGFKIKEGDVLALEDGKLTSVFHDITKAAVKLTTSMVSKKTSFITIIYGEEITETQAESVKKLIESKVSSNVEVTLIDGGQPVYYFLISVE